MDNLSPLSHSTRTQPSSYLCLQAHPCPVSPRGIDTPIILNYLRRLVPSDLAPDHLIVLIMMHTRLIKQQDHTALRSMSCAQYGSPSRLKNPQSIRCTEPSVPAVPENTRDPSWTQATTAGQRCQTTASPAANICRAV